MITKAEDVATALMGATRALRDRSSDAMGIATVLALLFLKRLSDSDPAPSHDATWSTINGSGEASRLLASAFAAVEASSSVVPKGLLTGIEFPGRYGERTGESSLLEALDYISGVRVDSSSLDPSEMGRAMRSYLDSLADHGKMSGGFLTPPDVRALLIGLLGSVAGQSVCDPACGTGLLLAELFARETTSPPLLAGQETNANVWRIAVLNLLLHGDLDARIELGDTLRQPGLVARDQLMNFDAVVTNPPFGLRRWGRDLAKRDVYHRFPYGVPPTNSGDLAFLLHAAACLNPGGRAVIVLPPGALFRGGSEQRIRAGLLEDDLVELVAELGPGLFPHTGISSAVVVLRRNKAPNRQGRVLMINALNHYQAARGKNELREADREGILGAFEAFEDQESFARVVTNEEILANDASLYARRYVAPPLAMEPVEQGTLRQRLEDIESRRQITVERMEQLLKSVEQLPRGERGLEISGEHLSPISIGRFKTLEPEMEDEAED